MESRSIFIVISLLAASAVVADAYRWVDEDGVVNYSDRQQPGAETVQLPTDRRPTSSYTPPQPATASANTPAPEVAKPFRYDSIAVSSPGAEVTLWDIGAVLDVTLSVSPGLQTDHQVRIILDGGAPQVVSGTSFQLEEVYRGVHNIQAEIIDQSGRLIIRSQPNRFYVQQNVARGR